MLAIDQLQVELDAEAGIVRAIDAYGPTTAFLAELHVTLQTGEVIVHAGDAADSMHFILDGRVGIMVPADDGRTTRVRSLGRYTTIGEMGLVANTPRSATIQAEMPSVLYVLNTRQFAAIRDEDPELSHKLLTYFVSVMAERLTFANRTIAVLRR